MLLLEKKIELPAVLLDKPMLFHQSCSFPKSSVNFRATNTRETIPRNRRERKSLGRG